MSNVFMRQKEHRESIIPRFGLQIGTRGDKWEENFIKNIDFSTMDDADDWSYLFSYSKADDFDLGALNSSEVTNMDYMFQGVNVGTLRLAGLTIGAETSADNIFNGTFNSIDFTGAVFYSLPANMFNGAVVNQGIQLRTLDVSRITSLAGAFQNAQLASLDLRGFNTSTITDMNHMFDGAEITTLLGLNTLDFSKVTDASYMFYCAKIALMDLSGANFASLDNASSMFYNAGASLSTDSAINLSNCRFPVITNASYMFYFSPWGNNVESHLNLNGVVFASLGLNADYMFANRKNPNVSLDLSSFVNVKITRAYDMFYNSAFALTDFTTLDLSEAETYNYIFENCETPLIHLKTRISYAITGYALQNLTYYNLADDVILELIFPPTVNSLGYAVYTRSDHDTDYLIKDSELYTASLSNFIYAYYGNVSLEIRDSIIHIGENCNAYNFMYYPNGGIVDFTTTVFDGIITTSNYFLYNCGLDALYLPTTGIKFGGELRYFAYGKSVWNYETQQSEIKSPVMTNLDKLDVSDVTEIYTLFYYFNGTYDCHGWDLSNVTRMQYLTQSCEGDFDFSNWNVENVDYIYGISDYCKCNLDLRNWNLSNATYIKGISSFKGGTIDFDGWLISPDQNLSCYTMIDFYSSTEDSIIYLPNTLYQPTTCAENTWFSYTGNTAVIDIYTNASDIETQGWVFNHIYTSEEPYGFRIHLNSNHQEFLNAIGGD